MSHADGTRTDVKACSRCGQVKPLDQFTKNSARRTGRGAYCKPCSAEWQREYRQREPERHRQYEANRQRPSGYDKDRWHSKRAEPDRLNRRRFALKVREKYGITLEQYDVIVARPCGICGATEGIVLDHCHASGAVREGLCKPCNTGLGHFFDSPERLRAAADYLEAHRS